VSAERQDPARPVVRRTAGEPDSAWDEFVASCPGGDLVQTTAWAATKRAVGQETSLVTLNDQSRIVGGGLIIARRLPAGLRVGYVSRGPLVDSPRAAAERVLDEVIGMARSMGVRLLIVQPALGGEAMDGALAARGFEPGCPPVAPEATIQLDLTRSEDELLEGMSSMRRRNIRKAVSSELSVERSHDVELFQRLHSATARRQGFVPIDITTLRAQWDGLAPGGHCALFIARTAGTPVAGLWLTAFAGVVTFKLSGWDAQADGGRNANEALHWAAIRWARANGAKRYDLGGFDRRAAELIIARQPLPEAFTRTAGYFKLGFGSSVVLLPPARWSLLGTRRRFLQAPARWILAAPWLEKFSHRLRGT
jgi:lipid II:glycine glycyltransferase (peptidoglycan interpeptide bridge formation enzyme)